MENDSERTGAPAVAVQRRVWPRCDDIPTHPLNGGWQPRGCHPVIAAIANWREKIAWPWPRAARLRREMLRRGIKLGLPRPLTVASANWSEWESVRNGAQSNMATPAATTYGLPLWNPKTMRHAPALERNEVWDNPEILRFVCHNGKARGKWPTDPSSATATTADAERKGDNGKS